MDHIRFGLSTAPQNRVGVISSPVCANTGTAATTEQVAAGEVLIDTLFTTLFSIPFPRVAVFYCLIVCRY